MLDMGSAAGLLVEPSSDMFHALLEATTDALIGVWPDGRIAMLNSRAEKLFGYGRGELIGQQLEVLVPDHARGKHPAQRQDYLRNLTPRPMGAGRELLARRKDGTTVPVEIALSAMPTSSGLQVLAAVRQIAEGARRAHAESQLAAIVQSSQDAIVGKDTAGVITSWNPAAEKLYGYRAGEIIGSPLGRLVAPDNWRNEEELLRRTVAGERIEGYETRRMRKDGTAVDVWLTLSPIFNREGSIVGVASVSRDVSGERQAEEYAHHLTQAILNILEDFAGERDRLDDTQRAVLNILEDVEEERAKVQDANTALVGEVRQRSAAETALLVKTSQLTNSVAELEQFSYAASHDLQEPLRKIGSFCQLLARKYQGQLDDEADAYITYVVDGVARMQQLITDLLAFARLGQSTLREVPVDTGEALRLALKNLAGLVEQNKASIWVPGQMPVVLGDLAQVVQLFQNLLANSLKFNQSERPLTQVTAERRGKEWMLSVADNGIGIDPQYADRIFAVFQRLHTREEYPGTGIGLAICRKTVEQMGGRIWFEPTPGGGTTFRWTVPHWSGDAGTEGGGSDPAPAAG